MSKNIGSISEFLIHAGTQYLLFDMGRGLRPIDPQTFLTIENGEVPVPYPRQQHFWCGIVYWNKTLSSQRYIWFIKLPLDERGCLVDAARQHFLEKIFTALATASSDNEVDLAKTEQNTDNPYIFVPNQQQLADFNAETRMLIGLPTCEDYQSALNYLRAPYVQDWQTISLQGLADVVAFSSDDALTQLLNGTLGTLPATVQRHLHSSLENKRLTQSQADVIKGAIDWDHPDRKSSIIYQLRALTQMPNESEREKLVTMVLNNYEPMSKDMLIVIAGRHWLGLTENNMMQFLEHAAEQDSESGSFEFFCSLFADIAQLPQTRATALQAVRNPNRSALLSNAIGALFSRKSS